VDCLRDLIKEIEGRGKKFIISSHSIVPSDIILRSSGFFYDPENLLIEIDPWMIYWVQIGDKKIYSPYLSYGSFAHKHYGIAAFKNVLNGVSLAHQLGYTTIHVMDYDFLPDFEDLEENKNILNGGEINFIAYKNEDSEMLGCFSLKLEKGTNFNFSNTSYVPTLGRYSHGVYNTYSGYIDEFRITKGVARYTSNFATQSAEFSNNANVAQYATKYVGLVGGINDSTVDYGIEKLSDSSLKIRKMTATGQPLSGSGSTLSASVDRVYVNVLDYTNVMVTSSYAVSSSYLINASAGESFHPFLLG
jgi:hypothetical protein